MNQIIVPFKLLKRILKHKYYVAKYCFELGLYWQGIMHDMSKFSWTEFSRACKYWDDNKSSLAREKDEVGYSYTFMHHCGRNPHHYEFWVYQHGDTQMNIEMPKKYVLELICDYLGACKAYGGDPRKEFDWFVKQTAIKRFMNENTYDYVLLVFNFYTMEYSLKECVEKANNYFYKKKTWIGQLKKEIEENQ